ncbi:MAG: hypothetical protein IKU86_07595 [Thermoguttaceae bacterium]|nr:hypothetical protein [Thermoguttaceae bacterium]
MKREIWEELVDRVVDGECSDEEKRALDEAATRNPEIRDAIRSALRIRDILRSSAGATVPAEFSERLRLAIERSDFWVEREVERTTPSASTSRRTRFERFGGRRVVWATTGAAVSFAAVAFLASSVDFGTRRGVETARRVDESVEIDKTEKNAVAPGKIAPTAPLLRRPMSEGGSPNAPVAVASDFYTRRAVDSENARRLLTAFLGICRENDVAYEKIDGDFELALRETTPEARRAILAWLDANAPEIAERSATKLAERWDESDESVRDVRVSFSVAENE